MKTAYALKARLLNKVSGTAADPPCRRAERRGQLLHHECGQRRYGRVPGTQPLGRDCNRQRSPGAGRLAVRATGGAPERHHLWRCRPAPCQNYGPHGKRGYMWARRTAWKKWRLRATPLRDETISLNSPLTAEDAPLIIISYPEVKLIEAEAALRAGLTERAYEAYQEAIRASMAAVGRKPGVNRGLYGQPGCGGRCGQPDAGAYLQGEVRGNRTPALRPGTTPGALITSTLLSLYRKAPRLTPISEGLLTRRGRLPKTRIRRILPRCQKRSGGTSSSCQRLLMSLYKKPHREILGRLFIYICHEAIVIVFPLSWQRSLSVIQPKLLQVWLVLPLSVLAQSHIWPGLNFS